MAGFIYKGYKSSAIDKISVDKVYYAVMVDKAYRPSPLDEGPDTVSGYEVTNTVRLDTWWVGTCLHAKSISFNRKYECSKPHLVIFTDDLLVCCIYEIISSLDKRAIVSWHRDGIFCL